MPVYTRCLYVLVGIKYPLLFYFKITIASKYWQQWVVHMEKNVVPIVKISWRGYNLNKWFFLSKQLPLLFVQVNAHTSKQSELTIGEILAEVNEQNLTNRNPAGTDSTIPFLIK